MRVTARRPSRQSTPARSSGDLADMSLLELAVMVVAGELPYEQVEGEYARRKAAKLDVDTGRPPIPIAPTPLIPAVACAHCGALSRAPIANEVAK